MLSCLRMEFKGDKVFPQEFSIYIFIFVLACDGQQLTEVSSSITLCFNF